jgi:hypothetical protein
MRKVALLWSLLVAACTREAIQAPAIPILTPPAAVVPPAIVGSGPTGLRVPSSCPVYAPGGGDVDTPEAPFPPPISALCVVDDLGGAWGVVNGDAPTAHVAVIPGSRELGVYLGIDPRHPFDPARVVVAGDAPTLTGWTHGQNQHDPNLTSTPLTLAIVASGPEGLLISLGRFDDQPADVGFSLDPSLVFGASAGPYAPGETWGEWFFLNTEPPAGYFP